MFTKFFEFIVRHNFKITVVAIILPLIIQFKLILFAPLIMLYDKIPSFSQTYDAILSFRSPFYEQKISATDELIADTQKLYINKKYSELALVNLGFIIKELFHLQEDNPAKFNDDVDIALTEINNFKFDKAQEIFNKKIDIVESKEREKYLGLLAMVIYFSDKIEAINYFNKGLTINPYNLFLLNNLGRLYIELESYENARIVFGRILKVGDKEKKDEIVALGYSNIGVLALKQKNYPVAFKNFNKALELNKKNNISVAEANQYTNIALTYEAEGKIDKACVNFRRARIIYHKLYLDALAERTQFKLSSLHCL